ncbi:MAG: tetratricopeptide repeat protein, partial [Candidatus Omnitrophica bacterium]|nr:tetratricopeptide repeat protein [Candidatus Omnitrophota bacterium]
PFLWIVLLIGAVYSASLSFGFTFLDDHEFIVENYDFIKDISNIGRAFTQTIFANINVPYYRPILSLSFILDAQIGGTVPFIYHLTNIALHSAVSCLLFLLLYRIAGKRDISFALASIFAVHPVLTQAVAWIPGRNDLLLGLFILGSFLALSRYLVSGSFISYFFSIFLFGLALFTKESAVVMPVLFVLFISQGRRDSNLGKGFLGLAIGWTSVAAFWILMRAATLVSLSDKSTFVGMWGAVSKSSPAFIQYLGKIFMPFNLSVYPTIHDTGFLYGVISALLVSFLFLLSKKKDWHLIIFGGAWFLLFLFFSFIRPSPECVLDFQEHRLYVPMMGFMVMLMGASWIKGIDLKNPVIFTFFLSTITLFSILTFRHEMNFRDKLAFWDNAVKTSPNAAFIHLRYGFLSYMDGLVDKAESEYKKAIELDPELSAVHAKLGLLYMDKKMYNEAVAEFREEIRLSPRYDTAYMCLGVVRYRQGKSEDAVRLWRQAIRINPYSIDARKNLAVYYQQTGDKARASCYARQLFDMGFPVPEDLLKVE